MKVFLAIFKFYGLGLKSKLTKSFLSSFTYFFGEWVKKISELFLIISKLVKKPMTVLCD